MAELKSKLPQEGTTCSGESLSEPCSSEQSSGCPSFSGGGKFRSINVTTKTKDSIPNLTQQIFHKGMFINRLRSNSHSGSTSLTDGLVPNENPTTNEVTEESNFTDIQTNIGDEINTQDWKEVNNRKRLRTSPETGLCNQKQTKLSYWLAAPIPTSNSFAELADNNKPKTIDVNKKQVTRPPPLFIDKVSNIQPLTKMLESVASGDYELKILQGERVKIQATSSESYSTIYKELKSRNTEFFTYQAKQERSFRVVLKHMHPTTDIEELKHALEKQHHKPTNIWNIKSSKTKQPLPIFYIDLQPSPNNKEIYGIKSLLNCGVHIEPPRPKRIIPQCSNCQQYGHTQKFCHRQPKCVKCAESHHTTNCPRKERSDKVKCILCDGNHPANYKGCIIYKELQKVKYPTPHSKKSQTFRPEVTFKQNHTSINSGKSYASATINVTKPNTNNVNTNIEQNIPDTLRTFKESVQALMTQMITLTQMLAELMSKLPLHSLH